MERHLQASTTLRTPFVRIRSVLREMPTIAITDRATLDERASGRVRTDLVVDIGGGAGIRQEVEVELGPLRTDADSATLPLRWTATGRTSMFPVFDGIVEVVADNGHSTLRLEGGYTAPLGLLGRVGDRLVGRRAAEATAEAFTRHLAERLDAAADDERGQGPRRPAPYAVDLRPSVGAENHLG